MTRPHSTNFRRHLLAVCLHAPALVVALAVAAAWLVSALADVQSLAMRGGLFLVLLLSITGSSIVLWQFLQRSSRRLVHNVKQLAQTEFIDLDEQSPSSDLINGNLPSKWQVVLEQLSDRLREQAERVTEAEQARAKAEVKAKRLAGEHARLSQILDGLQDPVISIDGFEEVNYLNASAAELLHIERSGEESHQLASIECCSQLVNMLLETNQHKSQAGGTLDAPVRTASGSENWYRIRCRALRHESSDPAAAQGNGAVAVMRDINEQKHVQRRNAEFVSAVSHEMKTPLTGIKAYVELLADGDAEDEATREEFLEVINSQADRLQRLIDNMLNLARMEAGVVEVNKQQISLNELLERAIEVVAPAAEQKSIELIAELSPMYLGVFADHDMLLQSAINLLSNAIKYTPAKGRVKLRSRLLGADIAFEVEDTGVGLSAEDSERVFDKFYRVKKDRQMAPGTGLGLPLAKHIVEDVHGGRLEVESEEGLGSIFRITLTEQVPSPVLV